MRKTLKNTVEEIFDDLGYTTRRALTFIGGKAGAQASSLWVLGPLVGGAIGYATGIGAGATELVTDVVTIAGVMGVSAGLVQMDHNHRQEHLLNRYRQEISNVTGKSPSQVQVQDLQAVASGSFDRNITHNPTLKQALNQSRAKRNLGVIISAVAAAATYVLVGNMLGHVDSTAFTSVTNATTTLLEHGIASFLTYNIIKQPLHFVAGKLLGLREETVDDAIAHIRRTRTHGKLVAQEQVLDVFIEAHPEIGQSVEQQFGKPFWDMHADEKIRVMQSIPKEHLDLRKTTEDINLGHIKPEELAFMAFGQRSGVERKQLDILPKRPPVMDSMWNFLHGLTAGWTAPARETTSEEVAAALPHLNGKTDYVIHTPDENTAGFAIHNTDEKDGAKRSFAAMVGRQQTPEGLSHVERYEQTLQQDGVLTR